MTRIVLAIVTGSVVLFILGVLLYVVLLGGFYESNLGSATNVLRDVPIPWAMVVSHVALASLMTYVLVLAGAVGFRAGVKVGASFGLLFGVAIAFDLYAVTNWSNVTVAFAEPFVTALRLTVASGAIASVLGKVPTRARS